jgi:hypothetical protein
MREVNNTYYSYDIPVEEHDFTASPLARFALRLRRVGSGRDKSTFWRSSLNSSSDGGAAISHPVS